MRKRIIFPVILLFAAIAFLLWYRAHRPPDRGTIQPLTSEAVQAEPPTQGRQNHQTKPATSPATVSKSTSEPPESNSAAWIEKRREQIEEERQKGLNEWRAPIDFYGKVVDENTNPVANASIHFEWNDLSEKGTSEAQTQSDAQGLFSLTGRTGKGMSLTITKQGYYTLEESRYPSYEYGDPYGHFTPDAANPVIFHLRKQGVAELLVRFRKSFGVPKNGTPIEIDLATGKLASSGNADFKVECWTDDQGKLPGQKFGWKCRVSLVGGGIQRYDEEFPFLAPEAGYQPADEIDMTVKTDQPDQKWQMDVQRLYFIRTSDGRFGRVVFRMITHGGHFCLVESYFNPSGSRNLEFDPSNAIQSGR